MRDIGGQTVWELIDQGAAGSNVDLVISEGNCKVLKLSDKTGEGVMTMYQVFNGVYPMFNDFHMESCYSGYFVMARIIQKLLGGDRELAPVEATGSPWSLAGSASRKLIARITSAFIRAGSPMVSPRLYACRINWSFGSRQALTIPAASTV